MQVSKNIRTWEKPEMVRIGRIGDIAGTATGNTENNGGNPCGGGGCGTKGPAPS